MSFYLWKFQRKQSFTKEILKKIVLHPLEIPRLKTKTHGEIPHDVFFITPGVKFHIFFNSPLEFPHAFSSIPLPLQIPCPQPPFHTHTHTHTCTCTHTTTHTHTNTERQRNQPKFALNKRKKSIKGPFSWNETNMGFQKSFHSTYCLTLTLKSNVYIEYFWN